ncbi:hypothetical protein [Clostridium ihumii]|uniref:hypothetical protein n=1 Tax=Clostridium ihumii TaxID=1470356 RepID=UPI000ABDB56B|nr:hypothetical protein [Clostridium ihumii]
MEKFCKWYLSYKLRKYKINDYEIVIRNDGNTIYKRNFEREESIKRTISKIK